VVTLGELAHPREIARKPRDAEQAETGEDGILRACQHRCDLVF